MEVGSLLREDACAAAACCTTTGRFLKDGVKERVRGFILIAMLTVSVGFSTQLSTRCKGKSGGEVRTTHSILIYCPTTVLLTTLSTTLLSAGRFKPWINTHLFPSGSSFRSAGFGLFTRWGSELDGTFAIKWPIQWQHFISKRKVLFWGQIQWF